MAHPRDPIDGQWADVALIEEAVFASAHHAVWTTTGGTDGCAQCKDRTFRERVQAGGYHVACAQELARAEGARGVPQDMACGDLRARLAKVVTDPRLGQWRHDVDEWAALNGGEAQA